jgi:hypothetical protein
MMSMSFNPKKVAHDIANGLVHLNPMIMKRYTPDALEALLSHLTQVERETRATQIPQEEMMEIKRKNQHLQHIHHAVTMITSYVKKRRLRL